jgi:hypothetical protein
MRGSDANIPSAVADAFPDIKHVVTQIKVAKPRIRLTSCENIAAARKPNAAQTGVHALH